MVASSLGGGEASSDLGRAVPRPTAAPGPCPAAHADDVELVEALRRGDEGALLALVERHGPAMLRFARLHAPDRPTAEDAVQDAWIGVLRGIRRFEPHAALRTWIFRILLNRLRTRLRREGRSIPFSRLSPFPDEDGPTVEPERFLRADDPRWPHHWREPPADWGETPDERLLGREVRALLDRAVAELPPAQRAVIALRDVEGWSAEETCRLLGLTPANQRVLLHRARAKVRRALAAYFEEE